MRTLVCYQSKTGFTARYAAWIAGEMGACLRELSQVDARTMAGYDRVIYGGGLYEGKVNGLKKARKLFKKSGAGELILFATGATPNAAANAVETQWAHNLKGENIPHFYMQSGLCYEKMTLPDRLLMKLAAGFLEKQQRESPERDAFKHSMRSSFDISDRTYIGPLLNDLQTTN